jgi:hypothetical protein
MAAEMAPGQPTGWWRRTVAREARRNSIGLGERIGNIIGVFFVLLFFLVLIDVQVSGVGFFTDGFGPEAQFLLYGSLLYGIFPALLRAFTADRNLGRLADIAGSVFTIAAGAYLYLVFPFDVPSLITYIFGPAGDVFSWVTNDLMKTVLLFAVAVSAISAAYNVVLYLSVREELRGRREAGAGTSSFGPGRA